MANEMLIGTIDRDWQGLLTPRMRKAFKAVERKDFLPDDKPWNRFLANNNEPQTIGYNQFISQPSIVAIMLQGLDIKRGQKVLDVGSGSGWTTALIAELLHGKGEVIGIERIPELVELGKRNLSKYNYSNARIVQAGPELGMPEEAPFDKILVSAQSREMPQALKDQLADLGRMVIPVSGLLYVVGRNSNEFEESTIPNPKDSRLKVPLAVDFVPLIIEPVA